MSRNGQILANIIEERDLKVANSSGKCNGKITRSKTTSKGMEQSVIYYVVVSQNMYNKILNMEIDEKKEKVLTNFKSKTMSDHNIISCEFDLTVPKSKPKRIEIFNFRNTDQLKTFKENFIHFEKF